jgi:hypothetical protein
MRPVGSDCDNGSEFINSHLGCSCTRQEPEFTRG